MLLKIPATRTPRRALIFVTLIVKILSCNKIFLWSMIKITLIVLLFNNQESRSIDVVEAYAIPRKLYAIEDTRHAHAAQGPNIRDSHRQNIKL
jgi:hypothetical protein